MEVKIAPSWKEKLQPEFEKPYFVQLVDFIKEEFKTQRIFPKGNQIFNAFEKCNFEDTKVVILVQVPYHGEDKPTV